MCREMAFTCPCVSSHRLPTPAYTLMFGGKQIDLVVSDDELPDMRGMDLVRAAVARFPDVQAILMSEGSDVRAAAGAILVLGKPVTASALTIAARRILR